MSFWNFTKNAAVNDNPEFVELRIEGDIVDNDDAWIYEWLDWECTSPNLFREELNKYKGQNLDLVVWIDSYGGDVFAAAGIYNALKEYDGKITVKIDGKAMSAATVIAMAGDEIFMSPVAIFMIHNPLSRASGYASDLRKTADVLDVVKETIINAYAAKTGQSRDKISAMMDDETYMSANVAVKEGFVDSVLYGLGDAGTEGVVNFTYNRLSIQNSADQTVKRLFALEKKNIVKQPKNEGGREQMTIKNTQELREAYPDLVAEVEASAKTEGASAERSRIQGIEAIAASINPDLVQDAKFTNPIDAKDLAFKALQNDAAKGKQYLADAKEDVDESGSGEVDTTPGDPGAGDKPQTIADKVKNHVANLEKQRRGIK